MTSAKVVFLDLDIPDDDPLRPAKIYVSKVAPGFRIFEKDGTIDWESDFIWLVVVNEEDGLDFKVRQTTDGKREVQSFWKEHELDTVKLRENLEQDPLWDVFQLRATVLLQNRVDAQIELLTEAEGAKRTGTMREMPWRLAERLRSLELDLLKRAAATLDSQVRPISLYTPQCELHHSMFRTLHRQRACVASCPSATVYLVWRRTKFGCMRLKAQTVRLLNYQIIIPASSRRNRTDDKQKAKLLDTEAVVHYLGLDEGGDGEDEEDFS